MDENNKKNQGIVENGYERIDKFDRKQTKELSELYKKILNKIDRDPNRDGLTKTPLRVAKSIQYLTQGYNINPDDIILSSMFEEDYQQMVLVKNIEIYSLCEHHMIPFFGKAHIAYIPDGYITGLSKIARVVDAYARRLQVQERLTVQIRDCIQNTLNPLGVAVVIEAMNLCIAMRGVQKQNSVATTSAFTGCFLKQQRTREEFIHLIGVKLH